ncbi:hypothetical protein PISMIDRAFT_18296 [Pisolithus microcarpus 441]|uniref:Uncharacterized protein n=1 Tax=Pisolithus microcarpus 441 TaxID=765257 RepID=A0A0C9Y812_9AGAM|nr:hypothetical protein BKA83DRAFT_18296 [Pisolithus microcarpus]KIK13021.1 hypothetical protein PISMIDRAFT_18296 [Pisolithus microcarpus 441]
MHHLLTANGSSEFYITSEAHRRYLGDAGCFDPHLIVVLDPSVQGPKFTVTAVGGDNTYTIELKGHFVRGRDDRVYSFNDGLAEEWVIIPREADGAYTIRRKADNTAWTAPSRPNELLQQILLERLDTATVSHQLFRFDPARE